MEQRGLEGRDATEPASVVGQTDDAATGVSARMAVLLHELRSPLAIAAMAAETLQLVLQRAAEDGSTADPTMVAEFAAKVERHSRLAARLLDRLDLARDIEQGTVQLATAELDLAQLVRETTADLGTLPLHGHTLAVAGEKRVMLVADPTAVTEILFNLVTNAVKYSDAGAAIELVLSRVQDTAQLVVRNHGTGVTAADAERIFHPYTQLGSSVGGMGMGLYLSRGLARAHGGELSVRPAARTGSEFVLTLPLPPPGEPAPSSAAASA